jgi:hypothetical protein
MHVEIDQSGRIETLTQDSALGFSDSKTYGILIRRSAKRKVFETLRKRYTQLKRPELRVFAAAVFLLIRDHLDRLESITIDLEYEGHDADIKGMLLRHIRKVRPDFPKEQISFRSIGRKSKAHFKAYGIFSGRQTPDRIIHAEELLSLL